MSFQNLKIEWQEETVVEKPSELINNKYKNVVKHITMALPGLSTLRN